MKVITIPLRRGRSALATDNLLAQLDALPNEGALLLWLLTPYTSITVNENADPTVQSDMVTAISKLTRECMPDGCDGDATAMLRRHLAIPIHGGQLWLGTWQGVHLYAWNDSTKSIAVLCHAQSTEIKPTHKSIRTPPKSAKRTAVSLADLQPPEHTVGLLHLKHTSAALALCPSENSQAYQQHVEAAADCLCPESWNRFFDHTFEGADDCPGHVKSTLYGCSALLAGSSGLSALLLEPRSSHSRQVSQTLFPAALVKIRVSDGDSNCVDVLPRIQAALRQHQMAGGFCLLQLTAAAKARFSLQSATLPPETVVQVWKGLAARVGASVSSAPQLWLATLDWTIAIPCDISALENQRLWLCDPLGAGIEEEVLVFVVGDKGKE